MNKSDNKVALSLGGVMSYKPTIFFNINTPLHSLFPFPKYGKQGSIVISRNCDYARFCNCIQAYIAVRCAEDPKAWLSVRHYD